MTLLSEWTTKPWFKSVVVVLIALSVAVSLFYPAFLTVLLLVVLLIGITMGRITHKISLMMLIFIQEQALFENLAKMHFPAIVVVIQRAEEVFILLAFFLILAAKSLKPNEVKVFGTPIDLPILLFILWGGFSGVSNGNPLHVTFFGVQDLIGNFLFFYLFRSFAFERERFIRYATLLLKFAMVVVVIGLFEEVVPFELLEKFGTGSNDYRFGIRRVTSLLANPNHLANFLFPFLAFLFISRKHFVGKSMWLVLTILVFFMSFSRQYWLGALCAVGFLFLRFPRALPRAKILKVASIGIVFGGLLFGLSKIGSLPSHPNALVPPSDTSYFRLYATNKSIEILADHPLAGVGPGRFGGFISRLFPSPVYDEYNFKWIPGNPMQIDVYWPQVWAEVGVIGFFLYLFIIFRLYGNFVKVYQLFEKSDELVACLSLVGLAFLIGLLVACFGSPVFTSAFASSLFFALSGILYSLYEQELAKRKLP